MLIFYEQNYLIYSNPLPNTSIGPTPKIGFSTRKVQAIQYKGEKRKKKIIWLHLIIEIWYENVGIQR